MVVRGFLVAIPIDSSLLDRSDDLLQLLAGAVEPVGTPDSVDLPSPILEDGLSEPVSISG